MLSRGADNGGLADRRVHAELAQYPEFIEVAREQCARMVMADLTDHQLAMLGWVGLSPIGEDRVTAELRRRWRRRSKW